MFKTILPRAILGVALLCGCAAKEQVYFRPIGDRVLYWYTYYPELLLTIPPDSRPTASAAVAARGCIEKENDTRSLVVNVRVVINNPTARTIELHRQDQYIAEIGGGEHQATRLHYDDLDMDSVAVGPGDQQTIRLQFRPGISPPYEERISFVYRFRYDMYAQAWPEDVRFVEVMPGEIRPPTVWMGVIIVRF